MESLGSELRDRLLGAAIEGTGGIRYHLRENLAAAMNGPLPADVLEEAKRRLTGAGSRPE